MIEMTTAATNTYLEANKDVNDWANEQVANGTFSSYEEAASYHATTYGYTENRSGLPETYALEDTSVNIDISDEELSGIYSDVVNAISSGDYINLIDTVAAAASDPAIKEKLIAAASDPDVINAAVAATGNPKIGELLTAVATDEVFLDSLIKVASEVASNEDVRNALSEPDPDMQDVLEAAAGDEELMDAIGDLASAAENNPVINEAIEESGNGDVLDLVSTASDNSEILSAISSITGLFG